MSEAWEQSFLPLDDPKAVVPPGQVCCAWCGVSVSREDAVIKQYYNGQARMVMVEYFCCPIHHHQWYIQRLQQHGL